MDYVYQEYFYLSHFFTEFVFSFINTVQPQKMETWKIIYQQFPVLNWKIKIRTLAFINTI